MLGAFKIDICKLFGIRPIFMRQDSQLDILVKILPIYSSLDVQYFEGGNRCNVSEIEGQEHLFEPINRNRDDNEDEEERRFSCNFDYGCFLFLLVSN